MIIPRLIKTLVKKDIDKDKIIAIYGPRRVGKTTLVKDILSEETRKIININADEQKHLAVLSSRSLTELNSLLYGYDILFIDEAQRIPDIGINLKIIHDNMPNIKIIVTGSSSLELSSRVFESLAGRVWTHNLYPICYSELKKVYSELELREKLEEFLLYGQYPEAVTMGNVEDKNRYLVEIVNSVLYKDILELSTIKHPEKIHSLLQFLAYQIGNQVSISELSTSLSISREAVERYIFLLEKSFVIFRHSGFSRNLRKELKKMDKIYFYDTGIRNALINDFKPLNIRPDKGQLWENWLMVERLKKRSYQPLYANSYFWRTNTGAEIDLIEEYDGKLHAYEFKYGTRKVPVPKTWQDTYNQSTFECINETNFDDFVNAQ